MLRGRIVARERGPFVFLAGKPSIGRSTVHYLLIILATKRSKLQPEQKQIKIESTVLDYYNSKMPSSSPTTTSESPAPSPSPTVTATESNHFKGGIVLEEDFKPDETVVIIGRGKRIRNHSGNKRFYALIAAELRTYAGAPSKTEKSYILAKVLEDIRAWNPQRLGFVKLNPATGRWHSPKDSVARVTVAQAFRDALAGQYSSSKHNKQRRRQIAKGFITEDTAEDITQDALAESPRGVVTSSFTGIEKRGMGAPVSLRSAMDPGMMHMNMPSMNTMANMSINSSMRMNMNTMNNPMGSMGGMGGMGFDLRSSMGNQGMGMGGSRKMTGQETLAHIRGIIQATTEQLDHQQQMENVLLNRVNVQQQQSQAWMQQQQQQQSMMMQGASANLFPFSQNTTAMGGVGNMNMNNSFEQSQIQDLLFCEPLPIREDQAAAAKQGDAFSASEQTSSFFLQGV